MATQKNQAKDTAKTPKPRVEKPSAEKQSAFLKNAPARVDRVCKALASLTKLARPASYEWSPAQLDKILSKLGAEFETMEARFRNPEKRVKSEGFSF